MYSNNLFRDKSIRCFQVLWEAVTLWMITGITEIDMNLDNTIRAAIWRNARCLLRLTALADEYFLVMHVTSMGLAA